MPSVLLAFEPPDGGVAEHVGQLALGLQQHGWHVEVAGPPDATIYASLDMAAIPVHRLPWSRSYSDPRRDLRALRGLARVVRHGRYGILHCHAAKAGTLGRPLAITGNVPVVYSPHALPFVGPFGPLRRIGARAAERALAPLTTRIICVSEHERSEAYAAGLGGAGRLRVVRNGCPPCDGAVSVDRELRGLRAGGPVVGAVAVLRRQKRLDVLIDATPEILERVPDARVAIVGNGPLRDALAERAAQRGLASCRRFRMLPFEAPVARYLRGLDVFALPSDWEGLPIASLEALACGVAQVATDVGGTPEAVTPATGVLIPPGDPAALADAVVALLRDEEGRRRMARAAVDRHRRAFTVDRMVAETLAVYDEVLNGPGALSTPRGLPRAAPAGSSRG